MNSCYTHLAKVYDILNYDCDYEKWSQYLLSMLPTACITGLDLGCGSGELTEKLAMAEKSMIGVDRSSEMLSVAQMKKKNSGTVYVLGDMRKLILGKRFDFINVSCDGVNYLNPKKEFSDFLEVCKKHLKSDGILLFDVSSEYKLEKVLGNNLFADDTEQSTYLWQNRFDIKKRQLDFSLILFTKEQEKYLKSYEEHKMFLYSEKFLKEELAEHGFSDVDVFDSFTFNPPKENSQRIQVRAKWIV